MTMFFSINSHCDLDLDPITLKREFIRGIVILNTFVKLYWNWIINEVARAMTKGEHTNERTYVRTYAHTYARHRPYIPSTTLLCEGITNLSINMSSDADVVYWRWKRNKNGLWLTVCFVPSVCLSIRKSCQRHDCSELGIVRNWVEHCNWQLPLLNQRKEKRKYVARPGIEPRTPDLRSGALPIALRGPAPVIVWIG